MKRYLFIVLLALCLVITNGCVPKSGPKDAVDGFMIAAKADDMTKVRSFCTGSMLEFFELIDEMQEIGLLGSDEMDLSAPIRDAGEIKIEVKGIFGEAAKVDVTIDGDTVTFVLIKTDGDWQNRDLYAEDGCLAPILMRTRSKWLISDMETNGESLSSMLPQLRQAFEMMRNMPEMPEMPEMDEESGE